MKAKRKLPDNSPNVQHVPLRRESEEPPTNEEMIAMLEKSYDDLHNIMVDLTQDILPVLLLVGSATEKGFGEGEDLKTTWRDEVSYCSFQVGVGRTIQLVAREVNDASRKTEEIDSAIYRPSEAYKKAKLKELTESGIKRLKLSRKFSRT